jgi:predicted outer membrane repeat protein
VAARYDAAPILLNCTFTGNSGCGGGAVYCAQATATLTGCHFGDNSAYGGGGALNSYEAAPVLEACVFTDNEAYYGGAIACLNAPGPSVTGCTFAGNRAPMLGGGAIYCSGCSPSILACTLVANEAGDGSGIASCYDSFPFIERTIIAGGLGGPAVYCLGGTDPIFVCCDIYGNAGGDWDPYIAGHLGIDGNICADPRFCDAAGGDWTLSADSPCAAANNQECGQIGAWAVGCGGAARVADRADAPPAGLVDVHPNPFGNEITLRIADARPARVVIRDVAGRRVRELRCPGGGRIVWDGCDAGGRPTGSGIYLLEVSQGARCDRRRIVRLR